MSRNAKNILQHELIGLEAEIVRSSDKKNENLSGKIIDETQKTLTIRTSKKQTTTIKNDNTYKIMIKDKDEVEISGKLLFGRPEDRIKKKLKSKWKMV